MSHPVCVAITPPLYPSIPFHLPPHPPKQSALAFNGPTGLGLLQWHSVANANQIIAGRKQQKAIKSQDDHSSLD